MSYIPDNFNKLFNYKLITCRAHNKFLSLDHILEHMSITSY
jgi:hypothetical protein